MSCRTVILLNSFSMFKKAVCLLLCLCLPAVFLSGCGRQKAQSRPVSEEWYREGFCVVSREYTYSEDGLLISRRVSYPSSDEAAYTDTFSYGEKGELLFLTRQTDHSEKQYSASLQENGSVVFSADGAEFLTLIFGKDGTILSEKNEYGYTTEGVYVRDSDGTPVTYRQNRISPSGSNALSEFSLAPTEEAGRYTGSDSTASETFTCTFAE